MLEDRGIVLADGVLLSKSGFICIRIVIDGAGGVLYMAVLVSMCEALSWLERFSAKAGLQPTVVL